MSATTSSVPKNWRRAPTFFEQARTAAAVGGVRSELPIWCWSAVQSSAPAPVPRWSNTTMRNFPCSAASARSR